MPSIAVTANVVQEGMANLVLNSPSELPIADGTTSHNDALPNKYLYPEFAGFSGERYLLSLAEQFAPLALWRTWQAMVSFQAPDNVCYVGVSLVVDRKRGRVGVKERKIYLDLAAMEERGWLTMRRARMPFVQQDNSIAYHPVTVKDFSGFYETAHDYHLWLHDPMYVAPERENIPLILEDPELVKRLVKFENYRRLLLCGKPGRKRNTDGDDCDVEQARTSDPKVNQYFNPLTKTDSLYRRDPTDQQALDRDSILSTPEKGTGGAATTIRKEVTESPPETKGTEDRRRGTGSPSKPKSPIPSIIENAAEDAKQVKTVQGYTEEELKRDLKKRGAAAAGIPAEQYAKLNGAPDDQAEPEWQERRRPAREIPAGIVKKIEAYARQYDDAHLIASDITRAAKIYFTAAQAICYFSDATYEKFFEGAVKAAKWLRGCEHTNTKGNPNRMPYFFTCLENAFNFSLEELVFLRTEDPLYLDYSLDDVIEHLQVTYHQRWQSGETRLDYRDWLQDILDRLEKRKTPKVRNSPTSRERFA